MYGPEQGVQREQHRQPASRRQLLALQDYSAPAISAGIPESELGEHHYALQILPQASPRVPSKALLHITEALRLGEF